VIDEVVSAELYDDLGRVEGVILHHDALSSVTATTTHAGDVVDVHTYRPFGERLAPIPDNASDLLYTGREIDRDTGLYYYRARFYDPEIGRFLAEDPIGFEGGINFYAYVGNNPVTRNDPLGLEPPAIFSGDGLRIDPEAGVVTGGFYIADGIVPPGLVGDDRPYVQGASLDQYRVGFGLDFTSGEYTFQTNESCLAACIEPFRFAPNPFNEPGSPNTIGLSSLESGGIGISLTAYNSVFGTRSPAIDAYLEINPNGSSSAFGVAGLENFPSFQLDQFKNGVATNLVNVGEDTPFSLYGQPGDRSISFGNPAGGGFVLYPSRSNTNTARAYRK
jgi:RHS repeat-associated protein